MEILVLDNIIIDRHIIDFSISFLQTCKASLVHTWLRDRFELLTRLAEELASSPSVLNAIGNEVAEEPEEKGCSLVEPVCCQNHYFD